MQIAARLGMAVLILAAAAAGLAQQAAAPSAAPSAAPPAAAAAAPQALTPKIVVQAVGAGGFDVAAWTPDSRHLFTASAERRELLLWDPFRGVIIDRLRLPSSGKAAAENLMLFNMVLQPDKRTLRIEGDALEPGPLRASAPRVYHVDIVTRRISIVPTRARAVPTSLAGVAMAILFDTLRVADAMSKGIGIDMTEQYGGGGKAERPQLPRSPDGRWGLVRAGDGFALVGRDGKRLAQPAKPVLASIADADLSPDDRRMAILTMAGNRPNGPVTASPVDVIDITTGEMLPHVDLPGRYDRVRWLDDAHYAALPQDNGAAGDETEATKLPEVLIVAAATGAITARIPARCHMRVVPGNGMLAGGLVGAALDHCGATAGGDKPEQAEQKKAGPKRAGNRQAAPALARLVDGAWVPLPGLALPADDRILTLAASPRGDRLAVLVYPEAGGVTVRIVDTATGAPGATLTLTSKEDEDPPLVSKLAFSADGRRLWLEGKLAGKDEPAVHEWLPDAPLAANGKPVLRSFAVPTLMGSRFANRGTRLLIGGPYDDRIRAVDLTTGKVMPANSFPGAAALGYMRSRPIIWAAGINDGVRLWDERSGQVLMTISLLPRQRHVVVGGDARYDTNMGPESESFRWLMSDRPFQSLAPQTLMRDYYEPQLVRKLMDCAAAANCDRVLKPVPPVTGLNRQLPEVRITGVTADEPGWANVRVTATDTTDPVNGRNSGVFGIKLLMNNREVARATDLVSRPQIMRTTEGSMIAPSPGTMHGVNDWTFKVQLPSDGQQIEFAAYGFNSDRVKSDTVRMAWTPPPSPRRERRAFVLTIGVNEYAESRLNLNFAVPDAELIADRLVGIPGYVTHHARLTTARLPNGRIRQVTSNHINMALTILAGLGGSAARDMLRAAGHDVAALDVTTPDDIVIISFSGHGHADAAGNFALLASDVRWGALDAAPDPGTTISADWLTAWLRRVRASEIAFIIDACHSGAAVATPGFKPGPMGDPGLGQLAFDKGIRILAATQADDVALENGNLQQGFLTAALGEGLTDTGGPADENRNGQVQLDEWLRYAVARVPALNEEVRRGGGTMVARGVTLRMRAPPGAVRVQSPSLFDFNAQASGVVLRGAP